MLCDAKEQCAIGIPVVKRCQIKCSLMGAAEVMEGRPLFMGTAEASLQGESAPLYGHGFTACPAHSLCLIDASENGWNRAERESLSC